MKSKLINFGKFFLFLGVGLFLFWLVYRDMDFTVLMLELKKVNYWWILLAAVFSILSHYSRALRWNLLIHPMGYKPRSFNTFLSILVMYITNLAIPRSGEVARCAVLKKYEKVPLTQLVGTVVVERSADFVMLLVLMLLLVVTQLGVVMQFMENNPSVNNQLSALLSYSWVFLLAFLGGILFLVLLYNQRHHVRHLGVYAKFKEFVLNLKEGFVSIGNLKNKWEFIGHTIFIWFMYFLMSYVVFFAYGPTANLGIMAGLAVLVMGGFGMVAPVQGGIGAWHFMAMETLFIYGIARPEGKVFALISHTSMTLLMVVLGVVAFALLPIFNKSNSKTTETLD